MPKSVYHPLRVFLAAQPKQVKSLTKTLTEIEKILNRKLPKSALHEGAWWGNETYLGSMHTQAKYGWIAAGWKAAPDLLSSKVTFTR